MTPSPSDQDLGRRVEELADQLAGARENVAATLTALAHELRSPLVKIFGFADLLGKKYRGRLDDPGNEYLDWIKNECRRMDASLDGMLQLLQIERAEIKRKEIDLSAAATAIFHELQENAPERRVELRIQPGLRVAADPCLLPRALRCLLENAWKFTGKQEAGRIEFYLREEQGRPRYYIRDNGAGFNMDQAYRLFLPFQRLHAESDFPGLGIGLALVKRIIERHGGEVFAAAEEGKGATFSFTLGQAGRDCSSGKSPQPRADSMRVL
jgi:light-regulated signal transduction histidine kinase (bacteriophytochrome)